MYQNYKNDVEFMLVYIREAHPTDGWQHPANDRDGIKLAMPKNVEEKQEAATSCVRKLDIQFTTLVDGMDAQVESNYSGWPDRLYLVGKDGRIAWKGNPGPGGFRPEELERAIKKELGRM